MGMIRRTFKNLLLMGAITLLSYPIALADPPTSCDSPPEGGKLKEYAAMDRAEIKEICGLDSLFPLDRKLGILVSRCSKTYINIATTAQNYLKKYRTECLRANALTLKSMDSCDSKECMLSVAKNYQEASVKQKDLQKELEDKNKEIEEAIKANSDAAKRYRLAQAEIAKDLNHQMQVRDNAAMNGHPEVASFAESKIRAGREERDSVPELLSIQAAAQNDGQKFTESSISAQTHHGRVASQYEQMATKAELAATRLPSASETGSKKPIVAAGGSAGAGSAGGVRQTTSASVSDPGIASGQPQNNTPVASSSYPVANAGMSSPAYSSPASADSGAYGGTGTNTDPLLTTNASSGGPVDQQNNPATASGYNLTQGGQSPNNGDGGNHSGDDSPDSKGQASPIASMSIGSSGSLAEGSNTSASQDPGKINATSASIASAGGFGSPSEARANEIARKEEFNPNLNAGAVTIAGSDVKSAVDDLAKELGGADLDLNLDLDLGELTAEEKAALAPLDAASMGANGAQRRIASAGGAGNHFKEGALQESESEPLFNRHRSALERAQKRGALILNIRKKL